MKLILIRHGETEGNINDIIQGHLPGNLTARGKAQAKALAKRLEHEKIDIIIASDLERVRQTIAPLIKHHPKVKVIHTPELRERNYGKLEGLTYKEYTKVREASGKERHEFKPEEGETHAEVQERAWRFLKRIVKEYKGKTVLVAAHGNYNVMLLSLVLDYSVEEALGKLEQKNTCVNIIDMSDPKKPKAELINCTKHLCQMQD